MNDLDRDNSTCAVLRLPPEILETIFSYFSYEKTSQLRIVCKVFDRSCQRILNNGYNRADRHHAKCMRKVKMQLPRRESERRNHPLSRHCDILSAIETRLSLLGMTFMKYVEMNLCCFIPGKVLDEIFRVLGYLETTENPPRAHEILQELRDISSMAMEYFDEHVVPSLKQKIQEGKVPHSLKTTTSVVALLPQRGGGEISLPCTLNESSIILPTARVQAYQSTIRKLSEEVKAMHMKITGCKIETQKQRNQFQAKLREFERRQQHQERLAGEQACKIAAQGRKMDEMSRKMLEYEQKIGDVAARFVRSDAGKTPLETDAVEPAVGALGGATCSSAVVDLDVFARDRYDSGFVGEGVGEETKVDSEPRLIEDETTLGDSGERRKVSPPSLPRRQEGRMIRRRMLRPYKKLAGLKRRTHSQPKVGESCSASSERRCVQPGNHDG
ncbi:PREDICTED: F-box only protein 28-like isoform X2 [Priapulus caudatus]|uniref:F-box only protein 28-like isoform X2 n=1 Tax=Priapulus caudatus TaxID=37621 RepID=A0ABM1E695_PRICU|nr:PREDICTED: F-box only protein 28-like isoform X2 [Priapulus caudatus]